MSESDLEGQMERRREKLVDLRSRSVDPFPPSFHCSHTIQEAVDLFIQSEEANEEGADPASETLAGRITAQRGMGKASFLDIRDGSGRVQVLLRKNALSEQQFELLKLLDLGDFVGVSGVLLRSKTGEVTVEANDITVLAKALRPLPEKWHGLQDLEKRYRQRYLDMISNEEARQTFRLRSRIFVTLRRLLDDRGFIEVDTPVLVPIAAGAMAHPFETHHNALNRRLYLRIATELYLKRLVIGGMDKVYELGRVFRNEGIDQDHNPEFTLLEAYQAYADYRDMMELVEYLVCGLAQEATGSSKVLWGEETIDFSPPWRRVSLLEEIEHRSGIVLDRFPDTESLGQKMRELGLQVDPRRGRGYLIDKLLSSMVEPHLIQPTFLVDYPIEMSPLAKEKRDQPHLVERFEGFAGTMEIANAFSELNDPLEQRKRMEAQETLRAEVGDLEETDRLDDDFLVALEHGMPPTGGLGIGIDRLVMLLASQDTIRDVVLFPQLRN
jgi:lysyl-tRNA synthetase class 2